MTDIIAKLNEQLRSKFPFAIYCKPGSTEVTGIFQTSAQSFLADSLNERGFVFAPFANGKTCFIPADTADIITTSVHAEDLGPADGIPAGYDENTKASFEALVAKSVAAIKKGQFEKLVVSRKEKVERGDMDIASVFRKLLYFNPMAYRYCFYHPESGLWMGATPEQLLKVENRTLHTVALAGTQLYREGQEAVWQEKEKQEQHFVTDYIMASLQDFSNNIHTTVPYTFRAGNIVHIKTDISAELKDTASLEEIIRIIHPTPAVCGLPKDEARDFIRENEGYNREYYSGYLGEVNLDIATGKPKTDLFVNLRCMKIEGNSAILFIGCGITKDSVPEKEFFETVNKSMTIKKIL